MGPDSAGRIRYLYLNLCDIYNLDLTNLNKIKFLYLRSLPKLQNIKISHLKNLEELHIIHCNLDNFTIPSFSLGPNSASEIGYFENIEYIQIHSNILNIENLPKMKKLKKLFIECKESNLDLINQLVNLEELSIKKSIPILPNFARKIGIQDRGLGNFEISNLVNLTYLYLDLDFYFEVLDLSNQTKLIT